MGLSCNAESESNRYLTMIRWDCVGLVSVIAPPQTYSLPPSSPSSLYSNPQYRTRYATLTQAQQGRRRQGITFLPSFKIFSLARSKASLTSFAPSPIYICTNWGPGGETDRERWTERGRFMCRDNSKMNGDENDDSWVSIK
jgi:hypothetical protein